MPRLLGAPAQKALDSLNISLTDQEGNLRNIITVYSEVAEAVKGISNAERMSVIEGIAGKYHISRMDALITDLGSVDSMYRNIEESSRNSSGSAMKENEQYMLSLEARIGLVRVEVERLALAFGEAFLTTGMIEGLKLFGNMLGLMTKLVDTVGALPVVLGASAAGLALISTRFRGLVISIGLASAGYTKLATTSASSLVSAVSSTNAADAANRRFTTSIHTVTMAQRVASQETVRATLAQRNQIITTQAGTLSNRSFSVSANAVATAQRANGQAAVASAMAQRNATLATQAGTVATRGMSTAVKGLLASTGVGLVFVGLGMAMEYFMSKASKSRQAMEDLGVEHRTLMQEFSGNEKEIDTLVSRYDELEKKLLINKEALSSDELREYTNIQNELAELLPSVSKGEDSLGNSIILSAEAIQAKVAALKEQLETEERLQAIEKQDKADENLKTATENLEEFTKKAEKARQNINNNTIEFDTDVTSLSQAYAGLKKLDDTIAILRSEGRDVLQFEKTREKMLGYINDWRTAEGQVVKSNSVIQNSMSESTESVIDLSETMNDSGKAMSKSVIDLVGIFEKDTGKVEGFFNAFETDVNIGDGISKEINAMASAFDTLKEKQMEGLSSEELKKYSSEATLAFGKARKSLVDMLTSSGIEKGSESFIQIMTSFDKAIPSIERHSASLEDLQKKYGMSLEDAKAFLSQVSDGTEQFDEATESAYKLESALDNLSGVSQQQIDDTEELMWQYEFLTGQLSALTEGTAEYDSVSGELTGTMDTLLGLYPNLSSESLQLMTRYEELSAMTERSSTENLELARTKELLLQLHPSLDKANLDRIGMIQSVIKNIEEEVEADSVLRKALEASRDKKLTADEDRAASGLRTAKAEIHNINEQIKALNKLAQAYRAHADGAIDTANKLAESGQDDAAEDAFIRAQKWSGFAKQQEDQVDVYIADLAELGSARRADIDILKASEAVMGKTKDATEKQTKAQKKATDAMEHSTFIADKYKRALEELNLEIQKQQDIQAKFPDYSKQHRDALEAEIKLQKDKTSLLQGQSKALQDQVKAGKIASTGIVTTSSEKNQNLSGWGGRITSGYGLRTPPKKGASSNHQGIDIAGANGTRIDSNVSGTVTFAGNKGNGLGNYVAIKDASGNTNIYGHLQDVLVKAGQSIAEGVALGTIGSTGTSTGNHLHYQVNDSSGKSIDPTSAVNNARKGISSASKEVANVQQAIDGAQSEIISLNGQIIEQEALISKLELDVVNSQLGEFNNKREIYGRILDYEAVKIDTLDKSSNRYITTLERNADYLQKKQDVNQQELDYIDSLRKSGTLSAITMEQMRIRTQELTTEMLSLNLSIQQLSFDKISAEMGKFDDSIDDISFSIERSRLIQEAYTEGSVDYVRESEFQIESLKKQQQEIVNKRNELQKLIMTENLSAEMVRDLSKQIGDLSLEYWQLSNSIRTTEQALADTNEQIAKDLANTLIESYKSVISARRDAHMNQLDSEMDAEKNRHDAAMSAIDREMDAEKERHDQIQKGYDYQIEMENKKHKIKMDRLQKELRAFERYIQSQIEGIDRVENTRTYDKDIDELLKERAEIQASINNLVGDDSYEATAKRKDLNKQLTDVDDRIFERTNAREIELRKDNYDDLLEKEQLKVEQITENETAMHEKRLDDINELKRRDDEFHSSAIKNLERQKKAQEENHKSTLRNIEEQKRYYTQFYEDQLNNEREFARIKEEIVKGNLDALGAEFQAYMDEMIATMPELENTMNGTMQAVGTSVRQNLIDNLREAIRLMDEFNRKKNTSSPVSSPSGGGMGGLNIGGNAGSSSSSLSSGDLNVLTGKFLNDKVAVSAEKNPVRKTTIKDKGHSLADSGRASGSTIAVNEGFDSVVSGMSKEEQGQLGNYLKNNATGHVSSGYLKDYIEDYANKLISSAAQFKIGGNTGKWSGGSGKAAIVHSEEEILTKGDSSTLGGLIPSLETIASLVNRINSPLVKAPTLMPPTSEGNIEINFHVEKMTGDKKDVDNFSQQIARQMKRERGIK